LQLEVFTQVIFLTDFFLQKLDFTRKNSEIAFCTTLSETEG